MARVKGAMMTRKRRKKTLKLAKGYFGAKSKLFKMAKQQVMKSGNYAFIGRKQKKRNFRQLWITRISAACRMNGVNYSTFMNGLKKRLRSTTPRRSPRSSNRRRPPFNRNRIRPRASARAYLLYVGEGGTRRGRKGDHFAPEPFRQAVCPARGLPQGAV